MELYSPSECMHMSGRESYVESYLYGRFEQRAASWLIHEHAQVQQDGNATL